MHISDGVLSAPVWIGSYAAAITITAITCRGMEPEEIPKTAIVTSGFFVASLVHIPLGPTAVHLILNGLAGILLGPLAFLSVFIGLFLQALLFHHGGFTTIGANSIIIGIPALVAGWLFRQYKRIPCRSNVTLFGMLSGATGVFLGAVILALFLVTTGDEFAGVARIAVIAHIPVIIIEAVMAGFIVSFIHKVKPEILKGVCLR